MLIIKVFAISFTPIAYDCGILFGDSIFVESMKPILRVDANNVMSIVNRQ